MSCNVLILLETSLLLLPALESIQKVHKGNRTQTLLHSQKKFTENESEDPEIASNSEGVADAQED